MLNMFITQIHKTAIAKLIVDAVCHQPHNSIEFPSMGMLRAFVASQLNPHNIPTKSPQHPHTTPPFSKTVLGTEFCRRVSFYTKHVPGPVYATTDIILTVITTF